METKNARVGNPTIDEINPDRRRATQNLEKIKASQKGKVIVMLRHPNFPKTQFEVGEEKFNGNKRKYADYKIVGIKRG